VTCCFNEQARLLLNGTSHAAPFMLPLSEEETIRLATAFLHCGHLDGSERSMKLKKKERFVNFIEYA
jgi:hypothetical protein